MSFYRYLLVGMLLIGGLSINGQALAQSEIEEAELPSSDTRPFRFGLRLGYSQSKYYADTLINDIKSTWIQSPSGALTFSYLWGDDYRSQFWVQTEIAYRLAGIQREEFIGPESAAAFDTTFNNTYTESLHQIGIPVLFRVKIGADKVKPFVSVGPYVGFNFMSNYSTTSEVKRRPCVRDADGNCEPDRENLVPGPFLFTVEEETIETDTDMQDVSPIEAGIILDAGLSIPLTDLANLKLSARYNLGLTRIYQENLQRNNRNQTIEFSLGVEF